MAFKIIKKDVVGVQGEDPIVTIVCDAASDVSDLPTTGCAAGSMAIVADSGLPTYVLNASGTWSSVD